LLRQLGGAADQKLGDLLAGAWGAVIAVIVVSLIKGIVLGVLFGIGWYWWLVIPAPFLLAGIWLSARWLVAIPAAVMEKLDATDALARSRDLTSGHRWTLMAWLALLWLLTLLLGKGMAVLFGWLGLGALAHTAILILSAALDATVAVVVYWRLINQADVAKVFV
jgi:Membrane domain of glycerophosphoryl diester phosphodiesterase